MSSKPSSRHDFHAVSYPVRLHSGRAALDSLPAELERCGARRAMLLCGRSVAERSGLVERIRALLGESLAGVYAGIAKDAPLGCVQEAVQQARACGADMLLAVGAGSVLKAARVVAILLAEPGPLESLVTQYPEGGRPYSPRLAAPKLPIVNILTAATSAQQRAGSALKSPGGGFRLEFFDPKTRPQAIFWDADALLTAPPALARSTAVAVYWRALMNIGALEHANPLVQGSRLQAFRLAHAAMARVADPADYQARIDLCAAALLQNRDEDEGGRPFDMHWIARVVYALAAATFNLAPGIGQGEAHAVLTAAALRQFGPRCPQVVEGIGRAIGAWEEGWAPKQAPGQVGTALERLFTGFGMPLRLRELGVASEQLEQILAYSLRNFNADRERSFINEREALAATLQDAW